MTMKGGSSMRICRRLGIFPSFSPELVGFIRKRIRYCI